MTQIISEIDEWRLLRSVPDFREKTVGFVPTMGNLHGGHLSLLDRARQETDIVVLSILVNPTQFDEKQDLESYPRTFEADLIAAREKGVDYLLNPDPEAIYPDQFRYRVTESDLSQKFCGKSRPGHFEGVLTVVLKLLLLVQPTKAYFGLKDYQQYLLVKGMVEAFFLDTEIVSCPTVRADDGLALSSRNRNLSEDQRSLARRFPEVLSQQGDEEEITRALEELGFVVDYVGKLEGRRLGAVRIGPVRLIDNVPDPGGSRV